MAISIASSRLEAVPLLGPNQRPFRSTSRTHFRSHAQGRIFRWDWLPQLTRNALLHDASWSYTVPYAVTHTRLIWRPHLKKKLSLYLKIYCLKSLVDMLGYLYRLAAVCTGPPGRSIISIISITKDQCHSWFAWPMSGCNLLRLQRNSRPWRLTLWAQLRNRWNLQGESVSQEIE